MTISGKLRVSLPLRLLLGLLLVLAVGGLSALVLLRPPPPGDGVDLSLATGIGNPQDRQVVPIPPGFGWTILPNPGDPGDVAWDRWRQQLAALVDEILARYPGGVTPAAYACGTGDAESQQVFALAVAYQSGAYPYAPYGATYPRAQVHSLGLTLLTAFIHSHITNDPNGWGTSYETDVCPTTAIARRNRSVSYIASRIAFAAWILWDDLPAPDQAAISRMLAHEADRFIQSPYYIYSHDANPNEDPLIPFISYRRNRAGHFIFYQPGGADLLTENGDTRGEEDAWMVRLLYMATAMLPNHPHWDAWMNKSLELAISSTALPGDVTSPALVNGKALRDWLNGSNIDEANPPYWDVAGVIINDNRVHPNYWPLIGNTTFAALPASLARRSTPKGALNDNVTKIYAALTAPIKGRFSQPICVNGATYGGSIYQAGERFVCYPEGLGTKLPKTDSFALTDTLARAYGFGVSADPRCDVPCFEDLHTQGMLVPRSQIHYTNEVQAVLTPEATWPDKVAEAYLVKLLQKQPYFHTPLKDYAEDLPAPWRDQDLGAVGPMGTATYSAAAGGTFTLQGAGRLDPGSRRDAFHFTYKLWQGDGEIVAHRPAGVSPAGSRPQAGIMIREELTGAARYAGVLFQGDAVAGAGADRVLPSFWWRGDPQAPSAAQPMALPTGTAWTWIKLVRHGNVFTAYGKAAAGAWTAIGPPQILPMSSRVYVGLIAAGAPDTLQRVTFDQVSMAQRDSAMGTALGIVGSAASADGADAANTYDGHAATRWAAMGNGPWIRYDLGSVQRINALSISWFGGADKAGHPLQRIQAFAIQVAATPALQWTTVFSGTSSGATHDEEMVPFMPVAAQYVRIVGYGNSTGWETAINEIHVYGAALDEVSVASGEITVSGTAKGRLANTRDTGLADAAAWESPAGPGAWIQLPVAGATVGSIAVAWQEGDRRSTRFTVQLSADGTTWHDALTEAVSTGLTRALELYTLNAPGTGVRYVRLISADPAGDGALRIAELKVYSNN